MVLVFLDLFVAYLSLCIDSSKIYVGAVGNAMSVNVLMRSLPNVLYSAKLLDRKPKLKRKFAKFLNDHEAETMHDASLTDSA